MFLPALSPALALALLGPMWLDGPVVVPGAPPARNPALAVGGGKVHAVYRVRAGGLGHMVAGTGSPFVATQMVPGGETSSKQGNKNYPALAVDATGMAHVAWGPASAPGNGARYLRIGSDGAPIGAASQISKKWIESIAVAVTADEVHVLLTAIKGAQEPDANDGVFEYHAPLAGGLPAETEVWPFPNIIEISVAPTSEGGLAVLGRFDLLKRIDLDAGVWTNFKNVELPAGTTSVGRPQFQYDGMKHLWAAIGWVDATPTSIQVRTGSNKEPWTALASGGLFDPEAADGEPAVALAAGPEDDRAVAWLAAEAPRLRVALGVGEWGEVAALPGTDEATSFALAREDVGVYRVVFVTANGTLNAGRISLTIPLPETTSDASSGDAGSDAGTTGTTEALTGGAETSGTTTTGIVASTGDASSTGATTGADATTGGDPTPTEGGPDTTGAATTGVATAGETNPGGTGLISGDRDTDGCACRSAQTPAHALLWPLLALLGLRRRRLA